MTIYKQIDLKTGDKIEIKLPTFKDISIIMRKYNAQLSDENALDVMPFFVKQLCLFNGKEKGMEFILNLSADIYYLISKEMEGIFNPIF